MTAAPRRVLAAVVAAFTLAGTAATLTGCGSDDADREILFGFNDDSFRARLLTADQNARLVARAGANVQRLTFDWRYAEPARDRYDFAAYDEIYRAMTARGVRPLFILMFAPEWTWKGDYPCTQFGQDCRFPPSPRHDRQWSEIAGLLARRYPKAAGIEIWNEPNLASFWGPKPDAARYTTLLRLAYRAIKRANPDMRVIGGSLNNVRTAAGGDVPLGDFARAMYERGAKGAMDALSVHPYPLSATDLTLMVRNLDEVRSIKDTAGDEETPLWVTEIGLSTTGAREQGGALSEEKQAEGLASLYDRLAGMGDVDAVIVHTLLDRAGDPANVEAGYGVVGTDLRPKPAFCALAGKRDREPRC